MSRTKTLAVLAIVALAIIAAGWWAFHAGDPTAFAKGKRVELADFKVTREADLLIVTYSVAAQEMIDGQPVSKEPSYRLSVFIPDGEDWQLLAHASLVAIQPQR